MDIKWYDYSEMGYFNQQTSRLGVPSHGAGRPHPPDSGGGFEDGTRCGAAVFGGWNQDWQCGKTMGKTSKESEGFSLISWDIIGIAKKNWDTTGTWLGCGIDNQHYEILNDTCTVNGWFYNIKGKLLWLNCNDLAGPSLIIHCVLDLENHS